MAMLCREFNLSEAHPSKSRQAAVERRQQQLGQEPSFQQRTSNPRGRSQSAGPQRPQGEQRLEQLSRPKTAHWEKCEYVCLTHKWSGIPIGACFNTWVRGPHNQAFPLGHVSVRVSQAHSIRHMLATPLSSMMVIMVVVRPCCWHACCLECFTLSSCLNSHMALTTCAYVSCV